MKQTTMRGVQPVGSCFFSIAMTLCLLAMSTTASLASADDSEAAFAKTLAQATRLLQDKSYQDPEFCALFNRSRAMAVIPEFEEGGFIWTVSQGHGILLWKDVSGEGDDDDAQWHVKKLFSYAASGLGPTIVGVPVLSWFGLTTETREIVLLAKTCDPTAREDEAFRCKGRKFLSPTAGVTVGTLDVTANPGELVEAEEIFALSRANGLLRLTVVQIPIGPSYTTHVSYDASGIARNSPDANAHLKHTKALNKIANGICSR